MPNYKTVVYKDIYPGIDLKYYGNGDGKMEYDFIIQPGADPSLIAVHYDGTKEIYVDDQGQLVIETEWGEVTERQPMIYQFAVANQIDGERQISISCEYVKIDEGTFGFRLGKDYDPALVVVIDPVLSYSTYLGGENEDHGFGIAVDGGGNAYASSSSWSSSASCFSRSQC